MIKQPEFRTCFQVEIASDQVLLVTGDETISLRGQLYSMLVSEIDGRKTGQEIARSLRGKMSPVDVYHGLRLLEQRGLIREASGLDEQTVRLSDLLATDPLSSQHRLESATVSVHSFGKLPVEPLLSILSEAHVRTGHDGGFCIVLVDDYLQIELESFNRSAVETGKCWMLAGVVGACAWVGPIFTAGSGCWECLRQSMRRNRPEPSGVKSATGVNAPITTGGHWLPPALSLTLNMAALQAVVWLSTGKTTLQDRFVTLNAISPHLEEHRYAAQPSCPACGCRRSAVPDARMSCRPIVLSDSRNVSTGEGGFRVQAPETTLNTLRHHLSPITGIVGPLVSMCADANDQLLNVYATRPNRAERESRFRSPALGKGASPVQAQVSALCEGLERHSLLFHGDEPRNRASYASLGKSAIHPNKCMLFSDAQYRNRDQWNSGQSGHWVPHRFDEQSEIDWSPVWSLTNESWRFLPTSYCFLRYPVSPAAACCLADSNGVAAGNCIEEAVLHGFFELVERDSVAIWWYNRLIKAGIDLEDMATPYSSALQNYYSGRRWKLWVLDLTTDLAIPAFAAVSSRDEVARREFIFGFGCHFDPRIAMLRALTEVNQSLALLDKGGLADIVRFDGESPGSDLSWLYPDPLLQARKRSDFATGWSFDLSQNVRRCVETAARNDLEVLALDLTRAGLSLNVVRVVVPGLRPWWPRFGAGRLYEVPVRMGMRERACAESELNSRHLYL